ncbi:calcium-binding protein [Albimonas sp. CAU 1670]|uniref:calcium-binding protein n=1 Tax=Albimonas sp. CAU 1670 TaxID=3032599 RepID=UPI0023DC8002|nr:calcium-binding protein [Albimonas sp. CAU 1670]MDF2233906.1 calcium-binding protein [Albimonas sp. CAU 1670]
MATIFETGGTTPRVLATNDRYYVAPGIVLNTFSDAVQGNNANNVQATIDGTVVSLADDGVYLSANGDVSANRVVVGQTGIVRAEQSGAANYGVYLQALRVELSNAGQITGGYGVYATIADAMRFSNSGLIEGLQAAGFRAAYIDYVVFENAGRLVGESAAAEIYDSAVSALNTGAIVSADGGADGFAIANGSGQTVDLVNLGEISGGRRGVLVGGYGDVSIDNAGDVAALYQAGVRLSSNEALSLVNSGRIAGGAGVSLVQNAATILNTGEIVANTDVSSPIFGVITGWAIEGSGMVGALKLINQGLIAGPLFALETDDANDSVRNAGEMLGDVALNGGADQFRNAGGTVVGDVNLGDGNDAYVARAQGWVDGRVQGGNDNDTLKGGAFDDVFQGGGGFDLLKGRAGDDDLVGGAGADTLVGGGGDDELTGGGQADVFKFGKHSGDDAVTDWTDGEDKLDFRKLAMSGGTKLADVVAASENRIGGEVIIDLSELGGDGSINVVGWNTALMSVDDFIF